MTEFVEGENVPDFEAHVTGNKFITLSQLRGSRIVLYFYPRDNTPGCTQEGQAFRDQFAEFEKNNALILGVSRDSLRTHENFKAKQGFPFDLISDSDEKLCTLFDVIKMKNMYGRKARGIERSTFLIDEHGKFAHIWRQVRVKGHVEEVLEKLRSL
ncbi:MAG: peroxiredoxin [Methylococcales bacterium]